MSDEKPFRFPDFAWKFSGVRDLGIHLVAGRGSGKSRFLGRELALSDYIGKIPTVVFDPSGDTIHNFLDAHSRYHRFSNADSDFSERIVHVMFPTGAGYAIPFPLYYRVGKESNRVIAERFVETVKRIDPELASASIQGQNALWRIGTMAGKILVTLNMQITEMMDLMYHTEEWGERLKEAVAIDPSNKDAYEFFTRMYPEWPEQWKASLARKLTLFTSEDEMRALFGASKPGIDWAEVIEKKQIVLLDFGGIHDQELSTFLTLWVFRSLVDFIVRTGNRRPVSIIVDELSSMMNVADTEGTSIIYRDLDKLLNKDMRHHNMWLTFAHQAMYQFPDTIKSLLLGMGSQMFGRIDNMDDALHLSKSFFKIDPLKEKRKTYGRKVQFIYTVPFKTDPYPHLSPYYGTMEVDDGVTMHKIHTDEEGNRLYVIYSDKPIDRYAPYLENKYLISGEATEVPIEYTIPEQHYESAEELKGLKNFEFFVRAAGSKEMKLYSLDEGEDNVFIDRKDLETRLLLEELARMFHYPSIESIISEIDARLQKPDKDSEAVPQKKAPEKPNPIPKPKLKIVGKKLND